MRSLEICNKIQVNISNAYIIILFSHFSPLTSKNYLINNSSRYFGKVQSSSATVSSSLSMW